MVTKGSGWHGEPRRHAEAVRKGMKTRYGKPKTSSVRTFKNTKPRKIQNKVAKGIETKPVELSPGEERLLHELYLCADNDNVLYKQMEEPIIENMKKKIKKGTYDPELAIKGWRYWVDEGAKRYVKELGVPFADDPFKFDIKWHNVFSTEVRNELAKRKAISIKDEIDISGEYD